MGFDNECILNLQSLPGEYFCPVCRTLIYPSEALQSQCTHLYCKPCLSYIVATTRACPYDGYLVTEADSKPLVESNKSLAETIGKVAVRCLYCRSGCQWQGGLSDCITHCNECTFGNSPVICNRCGTQILHRQVQEHGQTCPGMQAQAQQADGQTNDSKAQGQTMTQDQSSAASGPAVAASTAAPAVSASSTVAPAVSASSTAAPSVASVAAPSTTSVAAPSSAPSTTATTVQGQTQQAPTPEQWYQQQYQQYYQQYPSYDPYQTQYQQYAQYQQQIHPQYAQGQVAPQQVTQGYRPPAPYMVQQPHPQPQPQLQPQPQPQPQPQHQLQPQPQAQPVSQPPPQIQVTQPQFHQQYPPQPQPQPQIQAPAQQLHAPIQQPHLQALPQTHPPPHPQLAGQPSQPHPRPHHLQPQPQHVQALPQHHQSMPPQQLPQSQIQHPQSHVHPQPNPQPHPQSHLQQPPSQQPQTFPQPQPHHPSAQAVTGHQSYPQPQPAQQLPPGIPQQRPMQVHPQHPLQMQSQFPPQQTPQMRPPQAQLPMQVQQQPTMMPPQGPRANLPPSQQLAHHPVHQLGQHMHQHPGMGLPQQQAPHAQMHPGQPQPQGAYPQPLTQPQHPVRPQGPPYMQQQVPVQPHLQNLQVQNVPGRHMTQNNGMTQQPYNQSPAASTTFKQVSMNQQSPNQNYPARASAQLPSSTDLPHESVQQNQLVRPANEQIKQSESAELKISQSENDSKSVDKVEATAAQDKEEIMPSNDGKENLESAEQVHEKDLEPHANDESTKEPPVKVEASELVNVGTGSSDVPKAATESKGVRSPGEPSGVGERMDPNKVVKGDPVGSVPNKNNSSFGPQAHISENMQAPSQQYDLHKPPVAGIPGQMVHTMQHSSYGHAPRMPNPEMSQRPPAPDKMFPQHMPHPVPHQERKFPDLPPHQMQVHGQGPAPNQMAPPPHNFPAAFPHQGQPTISQEPFRPPMGTLPQGPYPVPNLPPSAMVPGPFGLHQKHFEDQTLAPRGQNQNHMPPSHAVGPRNFQGEPLGQPVMGGPLPGPRGPAFGIEDQMGRSRPPNSVEAEGFAVKGADFNGWQNEPRHHVPAENVPFGQPPGVRPDLMTMNGNRGFSHGLEERFKPLPEQGFKVRHEEQFGPSIMDPGARAREFEEDLKRFPRPAHLDREGMHAFDGYTSRPLDRVPQTFGPDAVHRPLDRSGGPFDTGDRLRPVGRHEDPGRTHDILSGHHNHRMDSLPSLRSPGREHTGIRAGSFGSGNPLHMDDYGRKGLHGFGDRSKGYNVPSDSIGTAFHESKFPKTPYFDGPGNMRMSEKGPGSFIGSMNKDIGGPQMIPSHLGPDEPLGHRFSSNSRIGEPTGFGSRYGFPEDTRNFNSAFSHGGMDPFEHSRMRKPGSMGWCRICKIDCGSVEDLDLHSQTREHQKMSMDMVLNIKQESAKKQRLTSDVNMSLEDPNKARMMSFESRMNRM